MFFIIAMLVESYTAQWVLAVLLTYYLGSVQENGNKGPAKSNPITLLGIHGQDLVATVMLMVKGELSKHSVNHKGFPSGERIINL